MMSLDNKQFYQQTSKLANFLIIKILDSWEDDPLLSGNPDYKGGGMNMSLNEARKAFKNGVKVT